jgi:hypothetical protein
MTVGDGVPPFDSVLFRRSTAAQRCTRELLLEAARLAWPQVNFNWHKLSKMIPEFKLVEGLANAAEFCFHMPREDALFSLSALMIQRSDVVAEVKVVPCRKFRAGTCNKGRGCRFSH